MASKSGGSARLAIVAIIVAFIAGCWTGMGSETAGDAFCVVTVASAPARPGFAPGQIVERSGDQCQEGEATVCGRYEPETGEDRRFVSEECEDD